MIKKYIITTILSAAMLLNVTGCAATNSSFNTLDSVVEKEGTQAGLDEALASMQPVTLRFGTNQSKSSIAFQGCQYWADLVSERSNGKIDIEVYESNTLGSQADMLDGLKMGTIDLSFSSPAVMSASVPEIGVFDLPYIFTTKEAAYDVLDGKVGREVFAIAEKQEGYYVLAAFEGGFRQSINAKREVSSLADYKGLKFRTPESSLYLELYERLGAIPTAMDMGEVFTALENGTVDGSESPLFTIYSNSWQEAAKYLTLDNHIYACNPILVSQTVFDRFPEEVQIMLYETCQEAANWEREKTTSEEDALLDQYRDAGVTVTELSDDVLGEIQDAVKPVWEEMADSIGQDIIDKVADAN